MNKIDKALKLLKINERNLKRTYTQFKGTRHIVQFSAPHYTFSMSKTFEPDILAFGVTNRCADGLFTFFAEYDGIYKSIVFKNLEALLKKFPFAFSNFYVAKTEETRLNNKKLRGNYHVVSFSKHFKYNIQKYMRMLDIDEYFRTIPIKTAHKTHVLRLSEKFSVKNKQIAKQKPVFDCIYPKKQINSFLPISEPHYKLFKKRWGFKDDFKLKLDGLKQIEMHKYKTKAKE